MTRGEKAAQTRKENKAAATRREQVKVAVNDEMFRVNHAIAAGTIIVIDTAFGPYQLDDVHNFDYSTHPAGQLRDWANSRTFMGCNDRQWARVMNQANERRNPLFATYEART